MKGVDKNKGVKKHLKVILLGDSGVGKTNIILRYIKDQFNANSQSTIGANFIDKELIRDNTTYKLSIWDTTGQEQYRSVTKLFIQGANIIILVYSIDQKSSLTSLSYWHKTITDICGDKVVFAIVANKYDLFDSIKKDMIVEDEEGEKYASEINGIFKTVSAKSDKKGIDSLFDMALDEYIKRSSGENWGSEDKSNMKINNTKKNKKKKGC